MDTETLVGIIKTVPEKHLLLLELAREVLDQSGEVRQDAASTRVAEVDTAVAEAEAYVESTKKMARQLTWLVQKRGR